MCTLRITCTVEIAGWFLPPVCNLIQGVGDGGFTCPRHAVEPEYGRTIWVVEPSLKRSLDLLAGPIEAGVTFRRAAVLLSCFIRGVTTREQSPQEEGRLYVIYSV